MPEVDVEMLAHMIRPALLNSGQAAVILLVDAPDNDHAGPAVLRWGVAHIAEEGRALGALALVARQWADEKLSGATGD